MGNTVVLAGGSGFIGTALAKSLTERGYHVVTLTRSARANPDFGEDVVWSASPVGTDVNSPVGTDVNSPVGTDDSSPPWHSVIDGAAAVINLTGRNVDCRHTPESLAVIRSSRVDSTKAIAQAIERAQTPPPVWVQGSAVGYYGDVRDYECTVDSPPGTSALGDITVEWEACIPKDLPHTRTCVVRTGVVLGIGGGALDQLARVTRLGLGGTVSDGGQYLSWIHLRDIVRIFEWCVDTESADGIYNGVSPTPTINREFMRTLRKVLRRPWSPPAPAIAIKIGAWLMGTTASLALESNRAVPSRLLEQGFQFEFTDLEATLRDLLL